MGMMLHYHREAAAKAAAALVAEDAEAASPVEPDVFDALTDEQVAEAYAVNVGGNAVKRDSQVKALRKLDADDE